MWDQPRSRASHCLPDLKESEHLSRTGYKVHQVESVGQRRLISLEELVAVDERMEFFFNHLDGSSIMANTYCDMLLLVFFIRNKRRAFPHNQLSKRSVCCNST